MFKVLIKRWPCTFLSTIMLVIVVPLIIIFLPVEPIIIIFAFFVAEIEAIIYDIIEHKRQKRFDNLLKEIDDILDRNLKMDPADPESKLR